MNYAVRQRVRRSPSARTAIKHPARPNDDLAKLRAKGAKVYVIREDLAERGIDEAALRGRGRSRSRRAEARGPHGDARPGLALVSATNLVGADKRWCEINHSRAARVRMSQHPSTSLEPTPRTGCTAKED